MSEIRERVLEDVEAKRHDEFRPELEADLSVNDWIGRLQGAARTAQQMARTGNISVEYETWVDIASIAVARAELLLEQLENPAPEEPTEPGSFV